MGLRKQVIEIGKSNEKGVSFANMPITDSDIQEICKNHHLVNINLESTNITEQALAYLATLPNLEYLWLSNTKITGEGFVHFAEHKKLRVIDANQTNLTDETLKIISKLPKLDTLHIDDTLITFAGMLSVADNRKLNLISKTTFSAKQLDIFKQTQRNLAKKKTSASISEDDILAAKNHLLAFFKAMTEWEKFANSNYNKGLRDEMNIKIKELYKNYATEKHHNDERNSWCGTEGGTYGKHQIIDIEILSKNRFYIYTEVDIFQNRFLMIRQKDNSWRIDNHQSKYGNWEKQSL